MGLKDFIAPRGPPMGLIGIKLDTGTVFGHGESIGEDRKSLSLIVSEFQRGCSWLPYANIW